MIKLYILIIRIWCKADGHGSSRNHLCQILNRLIGSMARGKGEANDAKGKKRLTHGGTISETPGTWPGASKSCLWQVE